MMAGARRGEGASRTLKRTAQRPSPRVRPPVRRNPASQQKPTAVFGLRAVIERVELDEIVLTLAACAGDVEQAAARPGVSRATLYRRMKASGDSS